jgi:electron transport complex protein RnfD
VVEAAPHYKKTLPPHIHSGDCLAKRHWGQVLALAPLFIAACFSGHAEILSILLVCLVSAVAFEFLSAKLFRKKERLKNGETILIAALFSLLMPSKCPSEIVILGVFLAIVGGRELFGGTGSYLLHPLLLARAFLQISFPGAMNEPMLLAGGGNLWTLVAIVAGGGILLKQRQGYWETPVLFSAVCFICEPLAGGSAMPLAFFSGVFFTAIFLLADPVGMPLTRKGTALFAIGAAFLSSRLGAEGFSIAAVGYAVLFMDLLTPWLDVALKPVSYKTKHLTRATYPS